MFNIPVAILPIDKSSLVNLGKHMEAANPFIIFLADNALLEDVKTARLPSLKTVVTIRDKFSVQPAANGFETTTWKELTGEFKGPVGEFPEIDESEQSFPVRTTFERGDQVVVSKFTHHNLAAAVAAHIKALPQSHQWKESDKVLMFTSQLTVFTVVSQLTALVCRSDVVFLSKMNVVPDQMLAAVAPTIIVTDDETTFSLLEQKYDLTVTPTIKQKISEVKLSRGVLPKAATIPAFGSVRLIYSSTCVLDNAGTASAAARDEKEHLNSADTNAIRALTGARFVHCLTSPFVAGPVASTNVYDYRLNAAQDAQWQTNYGPVAACLEAVLRDAPAAGSTARGEGKLCVRGFTTDAAAQDVEWVDTGILGSFGADGCFKLRN